ncbi:MAG: hypothetical protein Q9166_003267 [cf. Caloplaca sp. 2 TL-2023]
MQPSSPTVLGPAGPQVQSPQALAPDRIRTARQLHIEHLANGWKIPLDVAADAFALPTRTCDNVGCVDLISEDCAPAVMLWPFVNWPYTAQLPGRVSSLPEHRSHIHTDVKLAGLMTSLVLTRTVLVKCQGGWFHLIRDLIVRGHAGPSLMTGSCRSRGTGAETQRRALRGGPLTEIGPKRTYFIVRLRAELSFVKHRIETKGHAGPGVMTGGCRRGGEMREAAGEGKLGPADAASLEWDEVAEE